MANRRLPILTYEDVNLTKEIYSQSLPVVSMIDIAKFPFIINGSTSKRAAEAAWSSSTGGTVGRSYNEPLFQGHTE
jgi:hypothetical protein